MIPINSAEDAGMGVIQRSLGAQISVACESSSVPPSLLAAIIANESAGKPDAKRFEPTVLRTLWEVLLGRKADYCPAGAKRPLGRNDLLGYTLAHTLPGTGTNGAADQAISVQRLDGLATSWGLTQIMGWHVLEFSPSAFFTVEQIRTVDGCLRFTIMLLTWFAFKYRLDLATDSRMLLHCWNTGVPEDDPGHPTYDPNYVAHGLIRMTDYEELTHA
jgi:hypothetical protein